MNPHAPPPPELAALLAAMADEPEDVSRKLAVADWLEKHGDPRCELIRIAAENCDPCDWLARHGDWWPGSIGKQFLSVDDRELAWAWQGLPKFRADREALLIEQGWSRFVSAESDRAYAAFASNPCSQLVTGARVKLTQFSDRKRTSPEQLANASELRRLDWSDSDYLEPMVRPPCLRDDPGDAFPFSSWPKLRKLRLSNVAPSRLECLRHATRLESFEWSWIAETGDAMRALAGIPRLRELRLMFAQFDQATPDEVWAFATLEHLALDKWAWETFDELTPIARLSKLVSLELSGTAGLSSRTTSEWTGLLSCLPSLRSASIQGLKPEEVGALRDAMPQIQFTSPPLLIDFN